MAETTTGVDTPVLTDEEVDKAMADAFNNEGKEAEPQTDEPAAEDAKVEAAPKEGAADDKANGDDEVRIDREKLQQQNREIANLKRGMDELKELIKGLKPQSAPAQEAKDELNELMAEVQEGIKNGTLDESAGKLFGKLGQVVKDLKKQKAPDPEAASDLRHDLGDIKAERAFNAAFPELRGQWQTLSDKAWEHVEKTMPHASDERKQGAADFAFNKLAETASAKVKVKTQGANTTTDKTAKMKPPVSTKGAQTVQSSAAPSKDDLSKLSDEEIEKMMVDQLNAASKQRE